MKVNALNEATTLFVYGSLLDPLRRHEIIGRQVATFPAVLNDHEVSRARYFYVRKHPGVSTQGLLLAQLNSQDFDALDLYEDVPRLYTREKVEVVAQHGASIRCWVYLPTPLVMVATDPT